MIVSEHNGAHVRILDDTVVNQIAAGEVVERPASVVKELVENSIDAGADTITVSVDGGGRSGIEVIDNGSGMRRDDALLAVERFATSKLRDASDLLSIATLGFRGEALPSIAAVSKFALSTAPRSGEAGVEIVIEGGKLRDVKTAKLAPGTRIQVRQLFYNVPARRSFLRTENTELGLIRALLLDFAAAYPALRLRLVADGNETLNLPGGLGFVDRVKQLKLAGADPLVCREELQTSNGAYLLEAVLSRPIQAVAGSSRLRLIVNGRVVRDRVLMRALRDGYGNFLHGDRYPMGVMKLDAPPLDVDVNVHPQKSEIRFRASDKVFAIVRRAVNNALAGAGIVPASPAASEASAPWQRPGGFALPAQTRAQFIPAYPAPSPVFRGTQVAEAVSPSLPLPESLPAEGEPPRLAQMRFVGQIFNCYLLMEDADCLYVVDMHAAHERITFSRMREQFAAGSLAQQLLLVPEVVHLPADQVQKFREAQPAMTRLGFDCDVFGEDSVIIRSVPSLLSGVSPAELFNDLLSVEAWTDWDQMVERRADNVIARLACHASVRSGRVLERDEVYALLESLDEAVRGAFCPHGRPVLRALSHGEIEQMFGRA